MTRNTALRLFLVQASNRGTTDDTAVVFMIISLMLVSFQGHSLTMIRHLTRHAHAPGLYVS